MNKPRTLFTTLLPFGWEESSCKFYRSLIPLLSSHYGNEAWLPLKRQRVWAVTAGLKCGHSSYRNLMLQQALLLCHPHPSCIMAGPVLNTLYSPKEGGGPFVVLDSRALLWEGNANLQGQEHTQNSAEIGPWEKQTWGKLNLCPTLGLQQTSIRGAAEVLWGSGWDVWRQACG